MKFTMMLSFTFSLTFTVFPWRFLQMVLGFLLTALLLYFLPQSHCLSPGESSFGLYYHGGKIMTKPVTVSLLWVGTGWKGSGREAIRNALTSLTSSRYHLVKESEVPTLGNWWEIITQYRNGDNVPVTDKVDLGPECFYNGPELNMTRDQVIGIVQSAFNKTSRKVFKSVNYVNCTEPFTANENGIYHVVFSYHVKFFEEEKKFMDTCSGKFTAEVSAGVMVNMLWERAPQDADDICSVLLGGKSYLGPPNEDEKIDSLVGYVLGNTAEEVTNADGRGWFSDDGSRMTVTNSCASSLIWRAMDGPPLFRDTERNVSFNAVGLNGYRYTVPYVWEQKTMNCALKPSVTCGSNVLILKQPKGYLSAGIIVNNSNGLQPYPPNQKCAWKIDYPRAKFIIFEVIYMSIAADSIDQILICRSMSETYCEVIPSNIMRLRFEGSKAFIMFRSGSQVSLEKRGWELRYSIGLCNGRKDVFNHKGSIGYASSPGLTYVEGLTCNWVLHGKPGTPVSISFTHINISENLDFIAVYNGRGTKHPIANFTGVYSVSDLPRMNLSGEVMIAFSTQTDKGEGWSANFYISSPVMPDQKSIFVSMLVVIAMICLSIVIIAFVIILNKNGKNIIGRGSDDSHKLISLRTIREENIIGEGPSAIVYRAASNDGGFIAIKCIRSITADTELEQEILLKCTSHSRIVSLMGHAEIGLGRHVLLFEFMGRRDLAWNLKEKGETLNWDQRLAIALQVCSAIQVLHMYLKPPVYHGNITSENVLLDEFCNAKLGGFGVAKYCSSRENPGQQPSKMAEDIWSFGLLLVELLTGETQVDKQAYKASRSFEEVIEIMGNDFLDKRLEIPNENGKVMALTKLGEIAKWCIGGSCRVEGAKNNPKIGDVLSGLAQVKHLFCSVSG